MKNLKDLIQLYKKPDNNRDTKKSSLQWTGCAWRKEGTLGGGSMKCTERKKTFGATLTKMGGLRKM